MRRAWKAPYGVEYFNHFISQITAADGSAETYGGRRCRGHGRGPRAHDFVNRLGGALEVARGQFSVDGYRDLDHRAQDEMSPKLGNRTKIVAKSVAFGVNVVPRSHLVDDEGEIVTVA